MTDHLNKTTDMIGTLIRAWDFDPCPGRPDRFVDGIVTGYDAAHDLLIVDVAFDSTKLNRDVIYTAPFGHMMDDTNPIDPGHQRISVIA
jgi:hypothetical protein